MCFKFSHLCDVEVIKLCEPYECRGYSEDVVFVIGQRRRYNDYAYAGLICIKELLAIHMTRAKLRLYLMLHDMREGISLPPRGKQCEEGLKLGISRSRIVDSVSDPVVKRGAHVLLVEPVCFEIPARWCWLM